LSASESYDRERIIYWCRSALGDFLGPRGRSSLIYSSLSPDGCNVAMLSAQYVDSQRKDTWRSVNISLRLAKTASWKVHARLFHVEHATESDVLLNICTRLMPPTWTHRCGFRDRIDTPGKPYVGSSPAATMMVTNASE